MKYLEALKEKNLSVENLPKVLQKKIKELDFQDNELKKFESEDLDESELEDVEIVKQKIDELDAHIAHKVKKFDEAKYQEKLNKINFFIKNFTSFSSLTLKSSSNISQLSFSPYELDSFSLIALHSALSLFVCSFLIFLDFFIKFLFCFSSELRMADMQSFELFIFNF